MATTACDAQQAGMGPLTQPKQASFSTGQGPSGAASTQLCPERLGRRSGDLAAKSALFLSQLHDCSTALTAWAGSLGWLLKKGIWASLRGLGPQSDPKEQHPFCGAVSSSDAHVPSCSGRREHGRSRAWLGALSTCSQGRQATPAAPRPVVLVQQLQQFQVAKELGYHGEFPLLL